VKLFDPLSKQEIYERIRNFMEDEYKPMSMKLFCKICGISFDTMKDCVIDKTLPMSELTQRKVSRGLRLLEQGEVAVTKSYKSTYPDNFVFLEKPKKRIARRVLLEYDNDSGFSLKPKLVNKNSYTINKIDLTKK